MVMYAVNKLNFELSAGETLGLLVNQIQVNRIRVNGIISENLSPAVVLILMAREILNLRQKEFK